MKPIAGKVDLEELISAFKDLGLDIDLDEARNLLTRWVNLLTFNSDLFIFMVCLAGWTKTAA